MRKTPTNFKDFIYMFSKIGFSFLRGIVLFPFFSKHSHVPFLGKNISFICLNKIKFGKFVWLGHNGYLDAFSKNGIYFGNNVTIRENFSIQCRSGLNEIGDSLLIQDNTFIGPFSKIGVGAKIEIGKNCQFGSHVSINAESHVFHKNSYTSGKVMRKGVKIGNNVWVGDGVIILDGVKIGMNSVI